MASGDNSSVPLAAPTGNADVYLNAEGDVRQVVVPGNRYDSTVNMELPTSSQMITQGPNTLFIDGWSGTSLDTTDRWTVAAGTAPSIALGLMTMSATVSTYNAIQSKPSMPYTLGYQYVAMGINLEATAATGAGRFWGLGTYTASPTASKLVTDGVGFEIDQATGNLLAVTYTAAGGRTTVATLTRPNDGATHRYMLYFRPTAAYWYIDNNQVASAGTTATFPNVTLQELPLLIVRQNAASFTGTPTFTSIAAAVGDTSRMGQQLQDGTMPWRKAKVSTSGQLAVYGGGAGGTSGTIAAAGTGTVGPLDVSTAGNASFIVRSTVPASPWAGAPVLVFEQSDDNTSWSPLPVVRSDTGQVGTTFTLGAGVANASLIFDTALEGVSYVRVRVTTGPTTNGITIVIASGGMPFPQGNTVLASPTDGARNTYSGGIQVAGAAVGIIALLTNAGTTRLVRITRITFEQQATAAASQQIQIVRGTTITGTVSAVTAALHDSASPAPTATLGTITAGGGLSSSSTLRYMRYGTTVLAGTPQLVEWTFGTRPSQALILRPGQSVGINLGSALAGGLVAFDFEWTEEPI